MYDYVFNEKKISIDLVTMAVHIHRRQDRRRFAKYNWLSFSQQTLSFC